MDRKLEGAEPLWGVEPGTHLAQCGLGETYLYAKLIHPAVDATIDMNRKLRAPPPFGGGELGPHLTQCRLA